MYESTNVRWALIHNNKKSALPPCVVRFFNPSHPSQLARRPFCSHPAGPRDSLKKKPLTHDAVSSLCRPGRAIRRAAYPYDPESVELEEPFG